MKRLPLLSVCLALVFSPLVRAQDLTAEELEVAQNHLEKTRDAFLAATKGLSEAQWTFKPAPERWSVQQVSEHIASAEDFIMGTIRDQVMSAPPRSEPADLKEIDTFVLQAIADRSNRVQAPEPLVPTNRYGSGAAAVKHFQESRAKTLGFLKETDNLRGHAIDSPLGRKLDAYQWLLFISAHSERHTKQIMEVKADSNFPSR